MKITENSIIAIKNTECDNPGWVLFSRKGLQLEKMECSIGGIVFEVLNMANAFINNREDQLNYPTDERNYMKTLLNENPEWKTIIEELSSALSDIENKDIEFRNELLNKYINFAPAFFQGKTPDELINAYENEYNIFDRNQYIEYCGKDIFDGCWCDEYCVVDGTWLFLLDLEEVITNKSIHPTRCQDCGDFFMADSQKFKFCPDCNDSKTRNKRNYQKRKSDKVEYYKKRIKELLEYKGYATYPFTEELDYYLDKIKGKAVEFNPEYDNSINSKEAVEKWLDNKHKEVKEYEKKETGNNVKTDEKS